ncbi:MAG: class I SAM-dependent methyltransferase [Cyclobacteriaceae bacterium]
MSQSPLPNRPLKDAYRLLSPLYDGLAGMVLGKSFLSSPYLFLDTIRSGNQVLVLGGGTGKNLREILNQTGASGKVYYFESSSSMLARARNRLGPEQRVKVEFILASDFKKIPIMQADVIITQYFLDLLEDKDLVLLFRQIQSRTKMGCKWIFVDFFPERKKIKWTQLMITVFRLMTGHRRKDLPEYEPYFRHFGWEKQKEKTLKGGWIKARLYQRMAFSINPKISSLK